MDDPYNVVLKPPAPLPAVAPFKSVFLSGSMDLRESVPWRSRFADELEGFLIFDPTQIDFDDTWGTRFADQRFRGLVEWEVRAMLLSNLVAVNFCEHLQSPITLFELGLMATRGPDRRVAVHCPERFWKKGRVEIVCAMFGIYQAASLEDLIEWTRKRASPMGAANDKRLSQA